MKPPYQIFISNYQKIHYKPEVQKQQQNYRNISFDNSVYSKSQIVKNPLCKKKTITVNNKRHQSYHTISNLNFLPSLKQIAFNYSLSRSKFYFIFLLLHMNKSLQKIFKTFQNYRRKYTIFRYFQHTKDTIFHEIYIFFL